MRDGSEERRQPPGAPTVLIVEDDPEIRDRLKWALRADYRVRDASDRASALAALRRDAPAVAVLDLALPPQRRMTSEGRRTLGDLIRLKPGMKVIVVTGNGDRENALAAIAEGAHDFIERPVDMALLKVVLRRAVHVSSLEQENRMLRARSAIGGVFEEIVGVSRSMQRIVDLIRRAGAAEVPVLVSGEAGTEQELIARAIHRHSSARSGSFIAIHCGASPESVLERELFSHERRAVTKGGRGRQGSMEPPVQGTLFLDEIETMPLAMQAELFRLLQDGSVERAGGRAARRARGRIIAGTNEDLETAVQQNRVREDLFYRLSMVRVSVPPLRERGEDAVLIARALARRYASEFHRPAPRLSQEAVQAIHGHNWPGNVRELDHRIKRAVLIAEGHTLSPSDLELPCDSMPTSTGLKQLKARTESEVVLQALTACHWNMTHTAEQLGTTRQTLYSMVKKYNLRKPERVQETRR